MKVILLITLVYASMSHAMTPAQALELLRSVTDRTPLIAEGHRNVEKAYQVLAAKIAEEPKKEAKKKSDDGSDK